MVAYLVACLILSILLGVTLFVIRHRRAPELFDWQHDSSRPITGPATISMGVDGLVVDAELNRHGVRVIREMKIHSISLIEKSPYGFDIQEVKKMSDG